MQLVAGKTKSNHGHVKMVEACRQAEFEFEFLNFKGFELEFK